MAQPRALPAPHVLRQLYVGRGLSLTEIGQIYGVRRDAVYKALRRDARIGGHPWPLKGHPNSPAHNRQRDTITTLGIRDEILEAPVSRPRLAELSGVSRHTIQQIAKGHHTRCRRQTAEKIMRAIERLAA